MEYRDLHVRPMIVVDKAGKEWTRSDDGAGNATYKRDYGTMDGVPVIEVVTTGFERHGFRFLRWL